MIADDGFVVNPDHLVANAISSESSSGRISDNLAILNRAPAGVRHEVLRYIDNLSFRLIQNRPEHLSDNGILAWSELISDSGEINRLGQLRAAGSVLTFALAQTHLNVSPLVVVSFPIVYRELMQSKEEPTILSVLSMLFLDWDRCKMVRKELASSFIKSNWPPSDLLKASLPTGDLERILNTLSKGEGGSQYLRLLGEHTKDLKPIDRKRVAEIVDQILLREERR
jgi:hypothetical protein